MTEGRGGAPTPAEAAASLTPRLATLAAQVLPGRPVADIGTDHAYLPIYLVVRGICPRVVATDTAAGPLARAQEHVTAAGLGEQIELRRGDGLQALAPGEVSTVIMAGLGGPLIARLLAAAPPAAVSGVNRWLLQPMQGETTLRRWLLERGWGIVDELLVEDDGRLYVVLVSVGPRFAPAEEIDERDVLVGPILRRRRDPLLGRYLNEHLRRAHMALAGAVKSRGEPGRRRVAALQCRIRQLEQVAAELGLPKE